MALSEQTREALRAKSYILDILAGLVPSDPDFDEIWGLIPSHVAEELETSHAHLSDEYVGLAAEIREIRKQHRPA